MLVMFVVTLDTADTLVGTASHVYEVWALPPPGTVTIFPRIADSEGVQYAGLQGTVTRVVLALGDSPQYSVDVQLGLSGEGLSQAYARALEADGWKLDLEPEE